MWLAEAFKAIAEQWPWFWPVALIVLGGVAGSFIGCMVFRKKNNLPLRQPPSYCPACGHTLTAAELIPVWSWIWQKGKCKKCGGAIGWQSLALEITTIAQSLIIYVWLGPTLWLFPSVLVVWSATFFALMRRV